MAVKEERVVIEKLVLDCFPLFFELTQKLLQNYNNDTALLVKEVLKVFAYVIHLEMPVTLYKLETLKNWFVIFETIMVSEVSDDLKVKNFKYYGDAVNRKC